MLIILKTTPENYHLHSMKIYISLCFIVSFNLLIHSVGDAQNIVLNQTNESGRYKKGEKVRMTLLVKDQHIDSVSIRIRKNFANQPSLQRIKCTAETMTVFEEVFTEPTTVIIEAATKTDTLSIGCIVDAEHYKPGTQRPKDFDKYWNAEKKALRSLAMNVKTDTVKASVPGFTVLNVEINCTGPKPARGYFAKPESAKPRSLPIVIFLHAAGVNGSWCRSEPGNALRYAKMGEGSLSFDLNAHGMLNGQTNEYYTDLENGELKDYATRGLENKNDCYFRGMYLRLIRTIDFLTMQPEWDGKRILVLGESQGGGQSLAAAGLDHRVSAAIVTVPAMCDWGGTLVGRRGSFPYPFSTKYDKEKMLATVPYFDVVHILKGAKATIVAEIGLIDNSCPSSAVYAALNQAKGKKIIYTVPYRGHHMTQPAYKKVWDETVNKPKEEFLKSYLK